MPIWKINTEVSFLLGSWKTLDGTCLPNIKIPGVFDLAANIGMKLKQLSEDYHSLAQE